MDRSWAAQSATTQINMRLRRQMTPETLLGVLRGEIRALIWRTHLDALCSLPHDELQRLAIEVGTCRDIKGLVVELMFLAGPPNLEDLQADHMDAIMEHERETYPLNPKMDGR